MLIRFQRIINGLFKEGGKFIAVLAFGVSHLPQHAGGEDQDSSAHVQDSATLMDCPAAGKGQLLSTVPGPLSQFAGRLAYLSLWDLHAFFSSSTYCCLLSPPYFSVTIQALTLGGLFSRVFVKAF